LALSKSFMSSSSDAADRKVEEEYRCLDFIAFTIDGANAQTGRQTSKTTIMDINRAVGDRAIERDGIMVTFLSAVKNSSC